MTRVELQAPVIVPRVVRPNIAFCGKAGAGKTTCAEILRDDLGYTRISFAQPLKEVACRIWGPSAATNREKLQKLGVAVREIDEDAWVRRLIDDAFVAGSETSKPFVNDDLRFENEYWALKEAGWVIVRVVADRPQRVLRLRGNGKLQDESQLEHVSETALDHIEPDYVVHNQTDIFDLRDDIAAVLDKEARKA